MGDERERRSPARRSSPIARSMIYGSIRPLARALLLHSLLFADSLLGLSFPTSARSIVPSDSRNDTVDGAKCLSTVNYTEISRCARAVSPNRILYSHLITADGPKEILMYPEKI